MKAIVVGAGGATRELLRRLGELWDVTLIDTDESSFARAEAIRDFVPVVGDGSSALVLRRAGLDEADALVAATHDDDVNLEAVRIAKDAGLLRVLAIAADPERVPDYRALDVPVIAPDSLTARNIEVRLEPRRIASTAFAEGKAEAIEFYISPDSPVRGKRLRDFHSETWVVAAVLREGQLVVPHGATQLEAGDRVTVVGAAKDFSAIVKTFTAGESRFPLHHGRKVAVAMSSADDIDGVVGEAISLVRNTQAEELMLVYPDPAKVVEQADEIEELLSKVQAKTDGVEVDLKPVSGPLVPALVNAAVEESVGVLVAPAPEGGEIMGRMRIAKALNIYGRPGIPLLLARSRHPYSSILVPARRTMAGEVAGRAAIDLARSSGATLGGVAAVPPAFVAGAEAIEEARHSAAWLREEAAVQGVHVRRRVRRGNVIRVMEELASGASLVVLAMPKLPASPLFPGTAGQIIRRVPSSVLLVPVEP
jgi:Trk K+ transport system NAD-binding subunit/nucleotide-binding universal stress UspA family protein